MPRNLKNTQRLKAYKKDEDDMISTEKELVRDPQTIRSDGTASEASKLMVNSNIG